MHRWDFFKRREAPSARGKMRLATRTSQSGNINIDGTNASSLSTMFLPSQDGFFDVIEPGVRDLVKFFAIDLDLITYTSCEGHFYRDRGCGDERHVGLLPRNDTEQSSIWSGLVKITTAWNTRCVNTPMIAGVMEGAVRDDLALLPTLDLYLCRRPDLTWDSYFAMIDAATDELLGILKSTWPREPIDK